MNPFPQRVRDWWNEPRSVSEGRKAERKRVREAARLERKKAREEKRLRHKATRDWLWQKVTEGWRKNRQKKPTPTGQNQGAKELIRKPWSILVFVSALSILPLSVVAWKVNYGDAIQKHEWWEWITPVSVVLLAIALPIKAIRFGAKRQNEEREDPSSPPRTAGQAAADPTNKKEEGKGGIGGVIAAIVCVIFIVGACWLGWEYFDAKQTTEAEINQRVAEIVEKKKAADPTLREYVYTTENYPGQDERSDPRYVAPRTPLIAHVISDDEETMSFRVYHTPTNSVFFTLQKKARDGVGQWHQEDSLGFSGKWFLKERQSISRGYCLSMSADARPDLGWCDGYLTPK